MITVHRVSTGEACEIDPLGIEATSPYDYSNGPGKYLKGAKITFTDGSCLKVQETPEEIEKAKATSKPHRWWPSNKTNEAD